MSDHLSSKDFYRNGFLAGNVEQEHQSVIQSNRWSNLFVAYLDIELNKQSIVTTYQSNINVFQDRSRLIT